MNDLLKLPYNIIKPVYQQSSFHKSVIDEVSDEKLRKAYNHCRSVTRTHAKTFYMATRFLPNHKQRSIFAIYALCRYLDDLVDEAEDLLIEQELEVSDIQKRLYYWKTHLRDTYNGVKHDHPVLLAFSDVLKRYDISIELPFMLMEGVASDLVKFRYKNFAELYDYSYKVASVVGLMTSEVFGYRDKVALDYAVDLGVAMQLTNILRDVAEDLDKGRIYLPQNEMKEFGVNEDDLFDKVYTPQFLDFMKFQVERAREYYNSADIGIPLLNTDSQLPVYLARYNYSRILDRIQDSNYRVFEGRTYLNYTEKISILPKVWWQIYAS